MGQLLEQGEQLLDLAIDVLVYGDFHQRWEIARCFKLEHNRSTAKFSKTKMQKKKCVGMLPASWENLISRL